MKRILALVAMALSLALVVAPLAVWHPAVAQGNPAGKPADPRAEIEAAFAAAEKVQVAGPANVDLLNQAALRLPSGFVFVPAAQSARILVAMGNRSGPDLVGLVFGADPADDWMMVIRWEKSGYIKDDDARDWKADELLESLRTGTEQANEERRSRGLPEIEVVGWVEKPAYDAATHRLVWSASVRRKGAPPTVGQGVNYNTYALGREGYFSLNLVTELDKIERTKPVAHRMLAALDYGDGKRYADFNASTDHVAEFGIAALVAGVAAKKLGLFALIGVFLLKFWKILAIAALAFGGGLWKFFRRS